MPLQFTARETVVHGANDLAKSKLASKASFKNLIDGRRSKTHCVSRLVKIIANCQSDGTIDRDG